MIIKARGTVTIPKRPRAIGNLLPWAHGVETTLKQLRDRAWDVPIIINRNKDDSSSSSSESSSSSSSGSSSDSSSSGQSSSSGESSGGSSGSSGDSSGVGSSSDSGSDKSTAIIPMPWHEAGYGAMFTMEANQVLFEFVCWDVRLTGRETRIIIDRRFLHVCEPGTLRVCGAPCGDLPYTVGASIKKNVLTITGQARADRRPKLVNFKLTGIRKGFLNYDMPSRSKRQFVANEAFLNSAYPKS